MRPGYTATKQGWKNDVYQLAKTDQEIYGEAGNQVCLYDKVATVHEKYLEEREALQSEEKRLARYNKYQLEVEGIREDHIMKLQSTLESGRRESWLIYKKPVVPPEGWFNREENLKYRIVIICVLVVCYWLSITGIYNEVSMQEAVVEGLGVLDKITTRSWIAFWLFIVLEVVYFHHLILSGFRSMGTACCWLCRGCKFDQSIETKFDTPDWKSVETKFHTPNWKIEEE